MKLPNFLVNFLVRAGFLTECCHKGTYVPTGWWDRQYCNGCNRRIS